MKYHNISMLQSYLFIYSLFIIGRGMGLELMMTYDNKLKFFLKFSIKQMLLILHLRMLQLHKVISYQLVFWNV